MAKRYWTFDHTADIGLGARADSLGELMEALGEGLADSICPRVNVTCRQNRRLTVAAEDLEALAVDFLSEIMTAILTDGFAVAGVEVRCATQNSICADLTGEPYDPARHEIVAEVKAVTYHQLQIASDDGKWMGRVILDI